ncbi:MAG: GuaB3 family IMP dehydrogenase-related protein [Candidatus Margulisbacteria bacterium]|nr:GuaB3 family IMP dehydrogenase-related protein [Candidatus Margulisiibacteriota bacterium]
MPKEFERAYGFDEIALAPSSRTLDPDIVDISAKIGPISLSIPIIGSAMDSVVSPETAILLGKAGSLGILNLEGVQTRYDDPTEILDKISSVSKKDYVPFMQSIYQENKVRDDLVSLRIKTIKDAGVQAVISSTPQSAQRLGPIAAAAGADAFLIQSTVVSTHFKGKTDHQVLDVAAFCKELPIPVMVGNSATYEVTLDLMRTGVDAVFVGIGPGAACTTRGVLGIGIPMATSVAEAAAARATYFNESGRYVSVISDGGIVVSGDICKALGVGADAVMIGSPLAKATEAPGKGFHWGMATPNAVLPRGSRIEVGTIAPLQQILFGPSTSDDGSQNLSGAIRTCMATIGAETIADMHESKVLIAPSLLTEGKVYQKAQSLGMFKG